MKTFIIPTSTAESLAKGILAKEGSLRIIFPELSRDRKRYFPNGEIYMGIAKANKLKNKRVIVLHSGAPKPKDNFSKVKFKRGISNCH